MLFAMGPKFLMVYVRHQPSPSIVNERFHAYPQHIIHQRASPRPNLNQLHPLRSPPLSHPLCDKPDGYQLPEDLRYLRRRDKVSFLPELVAPFLLGHVVPSQVGRQAHPHERRKGNWTCRLQRRQPCISRLRSGNGTAMASESCFASGVLHCLASLDDHLPA